LACGSSERNRRGGGDGSGGIAGDGGGGVSTTGGVGARGGAAGRGGTPNEGGAGGDVPDACESPALPEAPLRRLTNVELENTFVDLFDVATVPSLPSDSIEYPGLEAASESRVEAVHRFAHDLALEATATPDALEKLLACDLATEGEAVCRQRFLDERIARVLRRPLDADDVSEFDAVFERGVELGGGFASGIRAVLEVALQSPEFLYHVELGEPADVAADDLRAGFGRPTPFEMASRLSYLYWRTTPDDVLVEAAARGGLRNAQDIAAQVDRLLSDGRARPMVRAFYVALLRLRPDWNAGTITDGLARLFLRETETFIDQMTFEERADFRTLLTAPRTWVNEELAGHYGLSGVSGDAFVAVELDSSHRGGILTQGSFLATHAGGAQSDPFRRGLAIYQGLLCQELAAPPGGVIVPIPELTPEMTTRERWELVTAPEECAACHAETNGIGYAFEHFDGTGRFRETEHDRAIDATGELTVTDAAGPFDGAVELASRIAESDDAKRCFVGNWLSYAYGRPETANDACSLSQLESALRSGTLRDLLVGLAQSDAFLYRPVLPEAR
jgi:hypothetical protein